MASRQAMNKTTDHAGALRLLASGAAWQCGETTTMLEDAADEIERLEAEVASLRLTLGGRTFGPSIPEPVGCPAPGACAQVAEIGRLRTALRRIVQECGRARGDRGHRDASRFAFATAYKAAGEDVADGR